MPGMVFRVIDVNDSIHRESLRLEKSAALTKDMQPVFERIFLDMLHVEERVFSAQGRRGGGSWRPLLDDTVRKKGMTEIFYTKGAKPKYSMFGGDTLVRSLTVPDAKFQERLVTNEGIIFGTSVPYASFLHEGTRKHKARPFIRFIPSDWARWAEWIGAWTTEPFETPL